MELDKFLLRAVGRTKKMERKLVRRKGQLHFSFVLLKEKSIVYYVLVNSHSGLHSIEDTEYTILL